MLRQGIVGALCVFGMASTGCGGQDAARISEVSTIQARSASDASVRAETSHRDARAREMERDLEERQNFYSALNGVYVGEIQTEVGPFKIRLVWNSVLSQVPRTSRVRTWEELTHDLNLQSLSVQIAQATVMRGTMSTECTVEGIRPDLLRGVIPVVSKDCHSSYLFRVAETEEQAREFARRILTGDGGPVREIFGEIFPGIDLRRYPLRLVRQ